MRRFSIRELLLVTNIRVTYLSQRLTHQEIDLKIYFKVEIICHMMLTNWKL